MNRGNPRKSCHDS